MKPILIFLLLTGSAFAEEVVQFNPTTGAYQGCRSVGDTNLFLTDPNDLTTPKPGFLVPLQGCASILPGVPDRYRKVVDTNADLTLDTVVELSPVEKDALDAPIIAEQARQQAFTDEIVGTTGNDICHAELTAIRTKIDAWLAARQAELDAATTNAQIKASLRNEFSPAVASAFLKVMKCVRAVQR